MDEIDRLKQNPLSALEIAVGDPLPDLKPQDRSEGPSLDGVFYNEVTRFVLKKARFSRDDIRVFDTDGELALVSHYPGKNPFDSVDPLGFTEPAFSPLGTWESVVDVSSYRNDFYDFEVRPKTLTIHGRQLVKRGGQSFLNVAKLGKLKTLSLRDKFGVFIGEDKDKLFEVTVDLFGRTMGFRNNNGDLVVQMTKTTKALIKTAILGEGTEFTIDIAPGLDCSIVLASVFGVMQVGNSLIKDAANNFLFDPLQDQFTEEAFNIVMGSEEESELLGFLGDQTEDGGLLEVFEGEDGDFDLVEGIENVVSGEAFEEGGAFEGVGQILEDGDAFEGFGEAVEGIDEGVDCEACCDCLCALGDIE